MKIVWKKTDQQYSHEWSGWVGKWKLFNLIRDSLSWVERGCDGFKLTHSLPCIKNDYFVETEDDGKKIAVQIINQWHRKLHGKKAKAEKIKKIKKVRKLRR